MENSNLKYLLNQTLFLYLRPFSKSGDYKYQLQHSYKHQTQYQLKEERKGLMKTMFASAGEGLYRQ